MTTAESAQMRPATKQQPWLGEGRRALTHLCWWLHEDRRLLVFGWVEYLPACFSPMRGHAFRFVKLGKGGARLFVRRFAYPSSEAAFWFERARHGNLRLPFEVDATTPGDDKPFEWSVPTVEPPDSSWVMPRALPFMPQTGASFQCRGLYRRLPDWLESQVSAPGAAEWLSESMFVDFRQHPDMLGNLLELRYDEVVRDVGFRLAENAENELARIRHWPGCSLAGYKLAVVDSRPLGITPLTLRDATGLVEFTRKFRVEATAHALMAPDGAVSSWMEPLHYLRTIVTNVRVQGDRRRVIRRQSEDGTVEDFYDLDASDPVDGKNLHWISGKEVEQSTPAMRARQAEQLRDRMASGKQLGLRWFQDQGEARDELRVFLRQATKTVVIVDFYFGPTQLLDYCGVLAGTGVDVSVYTTSEGLAQRSPDEFDMQGALDALNSQLSLTVNVFVMTKRLHDRFLILDGRVWLSGNSLNGIGHRESMMMEVPDPDFVLSRLLPIFSQSQALEDWLATRNGGGNGDVEPC